MRRSTRRWHYGRNFRPCVAGLALDRVLRDDFDARGERAAALAGAKMPNARNVGLAAPVLCRLYRGRTARGAELFWTD